MTNRRIVSKTALVTSMMLMLVWFLLGTNASIAWFHQEDSLINSLNFGDFKVNLYHKTVDGVYEAVDNTTKVFNDEALYEPGYTQTVFLKIENAGSMAFKYDMSVIPDLNSIVVGKNAKGEAIVLPDHLKFGLVYATTEDKLLEKLADREKAKAFAANKFEKPLSTYSESGGVLNPEESNYCALVLLMPETVGNEANYRGDKVPSVNVGIGVTANQIKSD